MYYTLQPLESISEALNLQCKVWLTELFDHLKKKMKSLHFSLWLDVHETKDVLIRCNILSSCSMSYFAHIYQKTTCPRALTAWNNNHVTEETNCAFFLQQSLYVWIINKQIGLSTLRFVYGTLVFLFGCLPSLLLCFLSTWSGCCMKRPI